MKLDIDKLRAEAEKELRDAGVHEKLSAWYSKFLGKKGIVRNFLASISDLSPEEKKEMGKKINLLKSDLEKLYSDAFSLVSSIKKDSQITEFYKTLPGKRPEVGHLHLITQAIREIDAVFARLGFVRVRYPEVDWDYFAFEALNMPKAHPARDEWETFFVDLPEDPKMGKVVVTPHTSSGQVREMLKAELPIRMLNISRCGRRQIDLNHVPTFYQFEGLVIDRGISISHLKGVLEYLIHNFFGKDTKFRLRPYDFRFTEPSFEVDVTCGLCGGKGCRFCKGGWVELGGAGMVHPNVLKAGGIDPEVYSGFAFGWGVERVLMMRSGIKIDDIRLLFENNMKFLEQF
ncbi:MAG: phenylalanine--tRNA ligase alpha subunit [Patescibacteria group bacterium]|nr:MAG: phenylalanine--tRNA ligase alpha subunit [Patescibacteria group bacterium]